MRANLKESAGAWLIVSVLLATVTVYVSTSMPAAAAFGPEAAGDLDTTFNGTGFVTTDVGPFGNDIGHTMAIQADGKIVVAGQAAATPNADVGVVRYNTDGSLDTSFDGDGKLTTPIGSQVDLANSVIIQPDQKILIVGRYQSPSLIGFVLRLNPDGSRDTTFGGGDGWAQALMNTVNDVALQPDGKIIVAGGRDINSFAMLHRLNADGTNDTGFGNGINGPGTLAFTFDTDVGTEHVAEAVRLQPDGKIVAGGCRESGSCSYGLARFTPDGQFDPTFDGDGRVNTPGTGTVLDLALQPDGKIIAVGQLTQDMNATRYNSDGTLDTSFNGTGRVNVDILGSDAARAVALQPDGKILLAGGAGGVNANFGAARLTPDGTLDNSFSGDGKQSVDLGSNAEPGNDGALDAQGRLVIAGTSNNLFAVARLQGDGVTTPTPTPTPPLTPTPTPTATPTPTPTPGPPATGKIVFVSDRDGNNEIYVMNANGTGQTRLTDDPGTDASPKWSPDGSQIVFFSDRLGNNEIYKMNADGSGLTQLTFDAASDASPDWSPDGSRIVFHSNRVQGNASDLFTMDTNGGDLVNVTDSPLREEDATYSPDGTKFALTCNTGVGLTVGICLMDVNGANRTMLQGGPNLWVGAEWSPNGSKIAYLHDIVSFQPDVFTVNPDGSGVAGLATDGSNIHPSWSGDGTKVVFASNRDGGPYEIYLTDASGDNQVRITNNSSLDREPDFFGGGRTPRSIDNDFDGDGQADLAVFRPMPDPASNYWYIRRSSDDTAYASEWGIETDHPASADYDGDGRTDIAVWREEADPDRARFYILRSSDGAFQIEQFGRTGDRPSIVGDWDGDERADVAVFRNGGEFYFRPSSQPGSDFTMIQWGVAGDVAVPGDFDGDGKQDAAVFRQSDSTWYIRQSSDGAVRYENWGLAGDRRVVADYDGDGADDLAAFRNGIWYIKQSSNGQPMYINFGVGSDTVVPADYDGDGRTDAAVYRGGTWYINRSTAGVAAFEFGLATDKPVNAVMFDFQ